MIRLSLPKTPENWHWKISPQDVVLLKQKDIATINKVYFANFEKFKKIVYNRYPLQDIEDALQSIYVLLPYLDYTDQKTFFYSLLDGCRELVYGHSDALKNYLSFDFLYNEDGNNLYNCVYFIGDELGNDDGGRRVVEFLDRQRNLSPAQKDLLCAHALGVFNYKGVFEDEKKYLLGTC